MAQTKFGQIHVVPVLEALDDSSLLPTYRSIRICYGKCGFCNIIEIFQCFIVRNIATNFPEGCSIDNTIIQGLQVEHTLSD
jgi:hypothetical protein